MATAPVQDDSATKPGLKRSLSVWQAVGLSLALKRSHKSWFLARAWREVTNGAVKVIRQLLPVVECSA